MTDGWFEFDPDGALLIWEGVCAVRLPSTVKLLKETSYGVIEIDVDLSPKVKITSNGYWTCAEVTGEMSAGETFYFHAINSQNANTVLKVISLKPLERLTVRLDPDPLRLNDLIWITGRIHSWLQLKDSLNPHHFQIHFDSNMPL